MDPKAFGVSYATEEGLRSTWEEAPVRFHLAYTQHTLLKYVVRQIVTPNSGGIEGNSSGGRVVFTARYW